MKYFCSWNLKSKTNGLDINYRTTIREDSLYALPTMCLMHKTNKLKTSFSQNKES